MSWWGPSAIDELVEKATSELLPAGHEDIALNLDICDQIKSKKINAKEAMRAIKRRLGHKNPNVQLATLCLADTCVKNGGELFVREVASREFMDEMISILKSPACNLEVKNKILSVIQTWGLASKNKPGINYMYDVYVILKAEGKPFPPLNENVDGILLETTAAPEWTDSDVCERCRTPFTLTNRKHHCRNCGGTFCQQCSSKTLSLPHLGINEPVRVDDGCYLKLKLEKTITPSTSTTKPTPPLPQQQQHHHQHQQEDDFDEDLKKAIELSKQEAERQKSAYGSGYVAPATPTVQQESIEDDPDLAAAIAASLKDLEISKQQKPATNPNDMTAVEMENILLFSNLMERVYATGGDVSNDAQINQLYTQIGALQPKLIRNIDEIIRKRNACIELHEKINAAVKAYDRLLEDRIAGVSQNNYTSYYQPTSYYPQPTEYHHNQYYSAPPQHQISPPQMNSVPQINNTVQMNTTPQMNTVPQMNTAPHMNSVPQMNTVPVNNEQSKPPVDDAPLIEL